MLCTSIDDKVGCSNFDKCTFENGNVYTLYMHKFSSRQE